MHSLVLLLAAAAFQPQPPKAWDDAAVSTLEVPLADPGHSPVHISSEAYYRLPERVLYRTYPVYRPDREPPGYRQWLETREPEVVFDASRLRNREEWIRAGELVFNAPTSFQPVFFGAGDLRDPSFYEQTGMPVAKDGTVPFARWVIRRKGQVELGSMGCNTCHTRVLADGTVVPGAQGNNPGDREGARLLRKAAAGGGGPVILERVRSFARQFESPWLANDPSRRARSMSLDEFIAAGEAVPPGVTVRANTSMFLPPQIPDLIGVAERRYLDHTGLIRQREIGDLMRYSSLAQDMFAFDRYPGQPSPPERRAERYSDAQLYALALYLYSLQPPANPNRTDARAALGRKVFDREGCGRCHTPPLYTNNRLVPVDGFEPPRDAGLSLDVSGARVGTDPRYALLTHKGTGYYKVPSLQGVWYRGPFEHNGSVATLEDWFDPARLGDSYVPTGFKGVGVEHRAVRGHPFGLHLPAREKAALIAFLRTL